MNPHLNMIFENKSRIPFSLLLHCRRALMLFPLSLLFSAASGLCDNSDRIDKLEADMSEVRAQTVFGNYGARSASAAPQTDGCGVFITGDFLWWKLYEGGTEYAIKNKEPVAVNNIHGPIKHLNFNWEPGFKAGLGYLFDRDGWDLYLNFTYLKTRAHSSTSSSVEGIIPLLGEQTLTFGQASAHWKIHFYDLDLVLGRAYFVSKYLALHPYFGLTSAWIQQRRRATYEDTVSLKLKGRNNFWGIGPKLGTEAQFYLGRNFSLYGSVAGALLWGRFSVKEEEKNQTAGTEYYDLSYSLHRMVAMVGFGLGGAYETNFNQDRNHFMIKLGYEGQYWWRQNQLPVFNSLSNEFTRQSEDLGMQGLTLEFRFDF